jgi:phosphate starvation-inducible membrane PsiE
MKSPFRFIIYLVLGMVIYLIIDSDGTSFSHEDARKTLILAIVGVFALLLVVTVIKNRLEK